MRTAVVGAIARLCIACGEQCFVKRCRLWTTDQINNRYHVNEIRIIRYRLRTPITHKDQSAPHTIFSKKNNQFFALLLRLFVYLIVQIDYKFEQNKTIRNKCDVFA